VNRHASPQDGLANNGPPTRAYCDRWQPSGCGRLGTCPGDLDLADDRELVRGPADNDVALHPTEQ
jgi:hypothetical protein